MGYYVTLEENDAYIPNDKLDEAYKAMCALNAYDNLKRGGSSVRQPKPEDSKSVSNSPDKWFSWMDWNYDETLTSAEEILTELGFYVSSTDYGLYITGYDSKTGNEALFIEALAPFLDEGVYFEWLGEDGSRWRWVVENEELVNYEADITWARRGVVY